MMHKFSQLYPYRDCKPDDVGNIINTFDPLALKLLVTAAELLLAIAPGTEVEAFPKSIIKVLNDQPDEDVNTILRDIDFHLKREIIRVFRTQWKGMATIPPTGYKTLAASDKMLVLFPTATKQMDISQYVSNQLTDTGISEVYLSDWCANIGNILIPQLENPMSSWLTENKKFVSDDQQYIMIVNISAMSVATDYGSHPIDGLVVWQYVAFQKGGT